MSSWTGADDDDSLGLALWSQQDPEFNTNFPVLDKRDSNPCVMLESTHQIKRWTGQGVHTVSSVWCRFIRDGTTQVADSGIAHEHG
jgi:hypothetical protein